MKILVTAGPTREPIDPVRYLSNRSSGKMGYAIAEAALEAGHDVTLISGPVCLDPPVNARLIKILTSDEMFAAVHEHIVDADLLVMSAAVADFKPAVVASNKIKKQNAPAHIDLISTRDILSSLANVTKKTLVVGFAAETESLAANAQKKLSEKKCDLIIGNNVSRMDTGFESDDNELVLFFNNGETRVMERAKKKILARNLVKIFETLAENR